MTTRKQRQTRRNRCSSGKTRFRDHKEALESLHHFQLISERDEVPCRTYFCTMCEGWHMTSKDFGWAARRGDFIEPRDDFEAYLSRRVKEKFDGQGY